MYNSKIPHCGIFELADPIGFPAEGGCACGAEP